MRPGVRRLLLSQVVLAFAVAVVMASVRMPEGYPVIAALYGGAVALVNTLLLVRRTRRAGKAVGDKGDVQLQVVGMMGSAVVRFVFTLVAFALGMALFKLDPIALLVGFAAAQLAYAAGAVRLLHQTHPE